MSDFCLLVSLSVSLLLCFSRSVSLPLSPSHSVSLSLSPLPSLQGHPGRLIKEEYIHDCFEMDLPSRMPPQPEHYNQPLPPLQMPPELPRAPSSVNLYPSMPLSPPGEID